MPNLFIGAGEVIHGRDEVAPVISVGCEQLAQIDNFILSGFVRRVRSLRSLRQSTTKSGNMPGCPSVVIQQSLGWDVADYAEIQCIKMILQVTF